MNHALATFALAGHALLAPHTQRVATVTHVTDGDTIQVRVPGWEGLPWDPTNIRIYGIDTPESLAANAKCPLELQRGLVAKTFGKTLLKGGDKVTFTYEGLDKYGRVLADVALPDKTDWATTMKAKGYAKPYFGKGPKPDWCTPTPSP